MTRKAATISRRVLAEPGSALIEAALVLPAVLVLAFGVVMTGRVAQAQVAVQAAAREAGRALAVAPSASADLTSGRERALAVAGGHGLAPERFVVVLDAGGFGRGATVRAQAAYTVGLGDLPMLGQIDVTVSSSHEERIELYRGRSAVAP